MREVKFIVPAAAFGPDEAEALAIQFGGYTVTECNGGWMSPEHGLVEDANVMITVAVELSRAGQVLAAAKRMAEMAEQEALYFVAYNGEVSILDLGQEASDV